MAAFVISLLGGGAIDFPAARVFQAGRAHGVEISTAADDEIHGDRVAFLNRCHGGSSADPETTNCVFEAFGSSGRKWDGFDFKLRHLQIDFRVHDAGERIEDLFLSGEPDFCRTDADFSDTRRGDGARIRDRDVALAQQVDAASHRGGLEAPCRHTVPLEVGDAPVFYQNFLRDEDFDFRGNGLIFKGLGNHRVERAGVANGFLSNLHLGPLEIIRIKNLKVERLGLCLESVHHHGDGWNGEFADFIA